MAYKANTKQNIIQLTKEGLGIRNTGRIFHNSILLIRCKTTFKFKSIAIQQNLMFCILKITRQKIHYLSLKYLTNKTISIWEGNIVILITTSKKRQSS